MLEEVEYCKTTMWKHFKKLLVMITRRRCLKPQRCATLVVSNIQAKILGSEIIAMWHQDCNLKLRLNRNNVKIPVIFHNLRGYDAHFMMLEIGKIGKEKNLSINCTPNNIERYMAFMMGQHLVIINYWQLSVYGIKSGQTGSKFAIGQIQIYQPSIPRWKWNIDAEKRREPIWFNGQCWEV